MIKTTAIVHLGSDAILNNVNGKSVINFNAAHSESYKNSQGETVNKSIWLSCSYWTDKTAIMPYLKKGLQCYVEGEPSVDVYTNKDGVKVPQLRLRVSSIQLLGSKQATTTNTTQVTNNSNTADDVQFEETPF